MKGALPANFHQTVLDTVVATQTKAEIVAINDLLEPDYLAYMLQYDSVHSRVKGEVYASGNNLVVNGKTIRLTAVKDLVELKWNEVGADIVIEAVGLFLPKEGGQKHLAAGAKNVIFYAPRKDDTPCSSTV